MTLPHVKKPKYLTFLSARDSFRGFNPCHCTGGPEAMGDGQAEQVVGFPRGEDV